MGRNTTNATVNDATIDGDSGSDSNVNRPLDPLAGINVDGTSGAAGDAGDGGEPSDGTAADNASVGQSDNEHNRGSGRGTRTTTKRRKLPSNQVDLKDGGRKALALQLVGLHAVAGVLTGTGDLLKISNEQAESLVLAVTDVLAQYKIKPNPKVTAWLNLAGIAGIIYVPKIIMLREIRKAAAAQRGRTSGQETTTPGKPTAEGVQPTNIRGMNFG